VRVFEYLIEASFTFSILLCTGGHADDQPGEQRPVGNGSGIPGPVRLGALVSERYS